MLFDIKRLEAKLFWWTYPKTVCSGSLIPGYLRDIRKLCNRKVGKHSVTCCLSFAAVSALFVLL